MPESVGGDALRRIVIAIAALIVLIIGAILIVPLLIPTDTVRSQVLARLEQATGRQVRIDGPISISLIPTVHVSASGIGLAGVTGGDALKVASLSLGVRLWPLLSGHLTIESMTIVKPDILYTIDKNGGSNWQAAATPPALTSAGAAKPKSMEDLIASSEPPQPAATEQTLATLDRIGIAKLTISDGTLTYRDERSGTEQKLTAMNLTLTAPDLRRGAALDGSFDWRGKAEKIAVVLGARPDVNKLAALPVDVKLSDDIATVAAKGTALAGDTMFSGTVSANGSSLAAFAGRFGTVLPTAPAYGKFAVSATVAATTGRFTIDKFAATLGDVQLGGRAEIAQGKTTTIAISTQSKALAFDFSGEAGAGGALRGNVSLSTTSLRNLLQWIGQPIGDGGGLQNFSIKGAIALSKDVFKFDRAAFTLDTSSGLGSGAVTFAPRLGLSAGLAMKTLDVTPYIVASGATAGRQGPAAGSGSGGSTGGGAWSTRPIAFAGLRAVDASLNLKADQIIANKIKIGATSLTATLAGGRLSAKLADMSLYQGKGSGALTIDGAAAMPAVAASFDLSGLSAQPFLTDAMNYDRLSGTGAFSFDLAATGTSQSALMHSLRGKGAAEFRDGSIRGFNLASLKGLSLQSVLGGQLGSSDRTDFSRLAGTYTISGGVLTNNDLVLIGPLVRATGAGTADIGNRTISYRLEPKIVGSLQGQGGSSDAKGLTLPFRVEGSWDDPRYVPEFGDLLAKPNQTIDQLRSVGGGLLDSIFGKDKTSNGAQPAPQQPPATNAKPAEPNAQPPAANPPAATGQQPAPPATGQQPTPPAAGQQTQKPADSLQQLIPQLLQQNGQ